MSSFQTNMNYELARLYTNLAEAEEKYRSAPPHQRERYADLIRDIRTLILQAEDARYGR